MKWKSKVTLTAVAVALAVTAGCKKENPEQPVINCGIWRITEVERDCETGEVIATSTFSDTLCVPGYIPFPFCDLANSDEMEPFECEQVFDLGECKGTWTLSGFGRSTSTALDIELKSCTSYTEACDSEGRCECWAFNARKIGDIDLPVTSPLVSNAGPSAHLSAEQANFEQMRGLVSQLIATRSR